MPKPLKSIPLSPAEEATLTALARKFSSLATSGPTVGQPSWRRLVRDIAHGKFVLRLRHAEAPALVAVGGIPIWWPRDDDGSPAVYAPVTGSAADECRLLALVESEHGFEARAEWMVEWVPALGYPSTNASI